LNKTILYIGGFILPDGNAAAHRVLSNAKILDKLGYKVVFIGTSNQQLSKNVMSTFEIIEGYSSYKVNYPTNFKQWLFYLTSIKNVKKIINQIGVDNLDTIIAYNYPSIALNRLLTFSRKNNIKLFSDCTEWAVESSNKSIRAILKNIDTYFRMHVVHPKLNGLLAISKYLFEYYSKKMNNVIYVPPLVDVSDKKWIVSESSNKDQLNLVYAGSPGNGAKDRIDLVVIALSKIKTILKKPFNLAIIGITKEQYINDFKATNLPQNIEENITFKGRLSHIEAIKEVQKADFSIFFRENNLVTKAGFPTKFVESITCGTPVLTNESSNLVDYLKDEKFGLILSLASEEGLKGELLRVLSLPNEEIFNMKQYCLNSKIFDFINFELDFEMVFDKKVL
jgi:glycosyltransferase involved in cell wall biosynthesis